MAISCFNLIFAVFLVREKGTTTYYQKQMITFPLLGVSPYHEEPGSVGWHFVNLERLNYAGFSQHLPFPAWVHLAAGSGPFPLLPNQLERKGYYFLRFFVALNTWVKHLNFWHFLLQAFKLWRNYQQLHITTETKLYPQSIHELQAAMSITCHKILHLVLND